MRLLAVSLRHSSTGIAGAVIAGLSILIALTTRRAGLNLWPDMVTGLSQAGIFTGTLAAGFAAFEAGRWATPASARMAGAVRTPVAPCLLHAGATLGPLVIGWVVGVIVLLVVGLTTGTYGSPFVPWLLALGAALLAASTFGYIVGSLLRQRWYVPPLAAVLFFGLYVTAQLIPVRYGIKSLFPVVTNTDSAFVRHLPQAMWGQTALFVGGAVAVVCMLGGDWRRMPRGVIALVIVCLGLASIGAAAVIAINGQYVTGYNSRDFVCDGSHPRICLDRGYAAMMPRLLDRFERLDKRTAGTSLAATTLEQSVQGVGDEPAPGARSLYIEENTDFGVTLAVYRYIEKYGGLSACADRDADSLFAVGIVNAGLSSYDEIGFETFGDGAPGVDEYRRFLALDAREVNTWLTSHEDAYLTCTLTLSDLP